MLQSYHFRSDEELEATLERYVWLYNQQLPQSALGSKSPLKAMKEWYEIKPEPFKKQLYYLPECDTLIVVASGIFTLYREARVNRRARAARQKELSLGPRPR